MTTERKDDVIYVMGRTEHERQRLIRQSALIGLFTRRFLVDAGTGSGMCVLDVGCGVGDVCLLAASRVGPQGSMVRVDTDPAALDFACDRAAEAGLSRVAFLQSDLRQLAFDKPFDSVVGRSVLLVLSAPMGHPGGLVAFQEPDYSHLVAVPTNPTQARIRDWWYRTAGAAGPELTMDLKVHQTFLAAGLPAPTLQSDVLIGGSPAFAGYSYVANVIRSVLPLIERLEVATAAEVDSENLADRLRDAAVRGGSCLTLQLTVGAYARRP